MTMMHLYDGHTAGGFFSLTLDLHVDETGTLFELASPRPAAEVPTAVHLDVEQARALARALLAGIAAAEAATSDRCERCQAPIVGPDMCAVCETGINRRRRSNLTLVP